MGVRLYNFFYLLEIIRYLNPISSVCILTWFNYPHTFVFSLFLDKFVMKQIENIVGCPVFYMESKRHYLKYVCVLGITKYLQVVKKTCFIRNILVFTDLVVKNSRGFDVISVNKRKKSLTLKNQMMPHMLLAIKLPFVRSLIFFLV